MVANVERRREPRMQANCSVKIFDPASRRYAAGVTRNVSTTGALIELHRPISIPTGEAVGVVIDYTNCAGAINQGDFSAATIARREFGAGQRLVAVHFVCPQQTPTAAAA
ncbi:PilZ domain-containing protein [Planctomycetales bacterium ZRK34]|nr:PilZ domain-containing protein [Planctomycetales bacterium ZRK34]